MSAVLRYTATEADSNKTVEKLLKREFDISTGLLRELKINKKIFVNKKPCRSVDTVCPGDVVEADVTENFDASLSHSLCEIPLDIIYEDDFLLVVNKKGGVESHPCPSNRNTTLANGIMYYWRQKGEYHNCHIVNRLDKDTSGICVFAKNRFAHGVLSKQINDGSFKKNYYAIVHGIPGETKGIIELPIARDGTSIIKRVVSQNGKYAKTLYKTVKTSCDGLFSLIDINLETGRTHQIRVHFSHIGHPLVGDWLYGNGDNERHLIKRHALHEYGIEFLHPATKEHLCFNEALPEELKNLINHEQKK